MLCPVCGMSNTATSKFCHHCGHNLGQATGQLPTNLLLAGRYLILKVIAQTQMSAVYQAHDTRLGNNLVAVKEMLVTPQPGNTAALQQAIDDFQREADLLAKHTHPNMPRVIDRFTEGDRHFLVMEFVHGQTLREVLEAHSGPLPEAKVLPWAKQLCSVLHFLHTRPTPIIYRDLKPENVMLEPDGTIKLIDFGIARFYKPGQSGDTTALGTPGYAAPEQFGRGQSDARTDIYALGVMLYELLTNYDVSSTPFQFVPASQLNPQISLRVERALQQAMDIDPNARFQQMPAFARALDVAAVPPPLKPTTPINPNPQRRWLRPALLIAIPLALLTSGWGGWMVMASYRNGATPTPTLRSSSPPPERTELAEATVTTPAPSPADQTAIPTAIVADTPTLVSTPAPTDTPVSPTVASPTSTDAPPPTATVAATRTPRNTITRIPTVPTPTDEPTITPTPTLTASPEPPPEAQFGHLAFAVNYASERWRIETLDFSSGQRQILQGSGTGLDYSPDWAPDGSQIAFTVEQDGDRDIWIMRSDGSNARPLATGSDAQNYAEWGPDNDAIILTYTNAEPPSRLFRIGSDGSGGVDLGEGEHASWSSWGGVLFGFGYPGPRDIWRMDGDGSDRQALTNTPKLNEEFAVWSPDGSRIAYVANPVGSNYQADLEKRQIWVMDADGSNPRQLTFGDAPSANPAWSPDGRSIAFVSRMTSADWQIWVMNDDGSNQQQLTFDANKKFYLSWIGQKILKEAQAPTTSETSIEEAPTEVVDETTTESAFSIGQEVMIKPDVEPDFWTSTDATERLFDRPSLYSGAIVTIVDVQSYAVMLRTEEGYVGWVLGAPEDTLSASIFLMGERASFAPGTRVVLVSDGIPLRADPSAQSDQVLPPMESGIEGVIQEMRGDWINIILDTGEQGWARLYYDGEYNFVEVAQ